MSNISIIDTGYPNISNEGTQESTANRANSGSAITLKCNEISYERGVGTDSNTVLGRYYSDFDDGVAGNPVNHASNETPKITLSGVFDRKTAADMNLILELDKLCTTKGIKLIYYNDTTDGYRELTDSLGTGNSSDSHLASHFSSVATPHLHVIFKNFRIRQVPNSTLLSYTLVCEVTA